MSITLTDSEVEDMVKKLDTLEHLFMVQDKIARGAFDQGIVSAMVDCRARGCMYCGEQLKKRK